METVQFWEALQLVFRGQFQGQNRVTQMSHSIKGWGSSSTSEGSPQGQSMTCHRMKLALGRQ